MDGDTEKNPFDTGAENPGYDETGEINEMDRFPSSSSRRGSEDINNPYHHRTYEETSFTTGGDERTPLLDGEFQENRQEAANILKSKFPKWNPLDSSFNATLNTGKSTKDVTTSCQESALQQELFCFVSVVLESEQLFLGLVFLSPHHLEALALFVEL